MSRSRTRFHAGRNLSQRVKPFEMFLGDIRQIRQDKKAAAGVLGTTVSSITWESTDNTVDLSGEALASGEGSVLIAPERVGIHYVRVTTVYSNGLQDVDHWRLVVHEPDFVPPPVAPDCPTILVPLDGADVGEVTSTTLLWAALPDVASYQIYFWADTDEQPAEPTATVTDTTYELTGLTLGAAYHVLINAVGTNGLISDGCSEISFSTNPADAIIAWQSATFSGDILVASVTLTAIRSGNTAIEASADYDFTEGSALIGPDFVATPGTVTFAPGEVTKDVVVPLVRDYDAEVLADEPWAYVKFDEASGSTFDDLAPNDRDFTMLGGAPVTMTAYSRPTLNLSAALACRKATTGLDWYIRRSYNGATEIAQDQDISFHGWAKLDSPAGVVDRCFCHVGGHAGAGQITKFQFYRRGSDGKLVCFWNSNNGVSTPSNFFVFDTPCPTLGEEFWFSVAQDCTNRELKLKINGGAVETISWEEASDPYQVADRQTFITLASSFASVWDHNPVGGTFQEYEFRLNADIQDRWPRWNLDAQLAFTSALSNPSVNTQIGAIDETTMTIAAP